MLEKTPKNALRIPFLRTVFPQAGFVFLYREPQQVLGSMIDGWRSGQFQTYPGLPDWHGPAWSFLLTAGWRQLAGRPLEEIVAAQWAATMQVLLDDLEALPAEQWTGIDHGRFLADPQAEVRRLCDWAGLQWDRTLDRTLPLSRYTLTAPDPQKWRRHQAGIDATRPVWEPLAQRAEAWRPWRAYAALHLGLLRNEAADGCTASPDASRRRRVSAGAPGNDAQGEATLSRPPDFGAGGRHRGERAVVPELITEVVHPLRG